MQTIKEENNKKPNGMTEKRNKQDVLGFGKRTIIHDTYDNWKKSQMMSSIK